MKSLKVKDLIEKLNSIDYNDETTISFCAYNKTGMYYEFDVEDINAEDRLFGIDNIDIMLEETDSYKVNKVYTGKDNNAFEI